MSVQEQNVSRIRNLLIDRRAVLEQQRERVERDLGHSNDPLVSDFSDQAVQRQNDETLEAIGSVAEAELAAVGEAIQRIDQGLYGACKGAANRSKVADFKPCRTRCCARIVQVLDRSAAPVCYRLAG